MLIKVRIKSLIYRSGINLLRVFWRLLGGRRITAFGLELIVSPDTTFPSYRKFKLPKGGCHSEIVRYADYVQMHAVCNFVSELQNQPIIIDIGAHHGAYAIVIGKMLQIKGGILIAVEPNPGSFEILKQNVALNNLQDTVFCEKFAVSDKAGKLHMLLDDSQSRLSSAPQKAESISVDVVTMEQLLSKHKLREISLLMIDVEGAELPVLRGFPWETVAIKKIFCELHPYAWKDFNYSGIDMKRFLAAHTFRCIDMYMQEHTDFLGEAYIGPTVFVPGEQ